MKIERSADDKWIAGVAGGLAQALGIDATIVRIVFAVLGIFSGTGILIYVALWVILPRPTGGTIAEDGIAKAKAWNADRTGRNTGSAHEPKDDSDFTI